MKLLSDMMVPYVLPRAEYANPKPTDIRRIALATRDAFVPTKRSGEAGELLLFVILEANGIVQLYSKMGLKTSPRMHFHGYDAVHIEVKEDGTIVWHFGHAKIRSDFNNALTGALSDVERFEKDTVQKETEFRLIHRHLDDSKFGRSAELIRKLVNPYYLHGKDLEEVNTVLIGSDWEFMKDWWMQLDGKLDTTMKTRYAGLIESTALVIAEKISLQDGVKSLRFLFLILPFESVEGFREKFREELDRAI